MGSASDFPMVFGDVDDDFRKIREKYAALARKRLDRKRKKFDKQYGTGAFDANRLDSRPEIVEMFKEFEEYETQYWDPIGRSLLHHPKKDEGLEASISWYDLEERLERLRARSPLGNRLISDFHWVGWRVILDAFNWQCAYCGSREDLEQDHVEPIVRGGHDLLSNLVPACRSCNSSKHARVATDWLRGRGPAFEAAALARIDAASRRLAETERAR